MIHLLQLLNRIDDLNLFESLFADLNQELKELELVADSDVVDYVNSIIEAHFGLVVENLRQLHSIVNVLRQPTKLKAALGVVRMGRWQEEDAELEMEGL